VADLAAGFAENLGGGAVGGLMGGGPRQHPDRYRIANPAD